jgi:hypothetical protein
MNSTATFDHIILKTELVNSVEFGSAYANILDTPEIPSTPCSNHLLEDVAELYNSIVMSYSSLSEFQEEMLFKIFEQFDNIRQNIDPHRLKDFSYYQNDDNELLLYRNTELGLINIIIHSDESLAFSFIPNEGQSTLYFMEKGGDFETLAFNFFSR